MSHLLGRRETFGFKNLVGLWHFQACKVEPLAKFRHGKWNEELGHSELIAVLSSCSASTSGACQSRLEVSDR